LQWLIFALLSIASMVFFRRQLYDMLRKHTEHMRSGPAGEEVMVTIDLAPGASCRVDFRGSTWTAQNNGDQTITADSRARIVRVDGLTLQVRSSN
jgi:membrane protein implicated in regulation of membrane protease activity